MSSLSTIRRCFRDSSFEIVTHAAIDTVSARWLSSEPGDSLLSRSGSKGGGSPPVPPPQMKFSCILQILVREKKLFFNTSEYTKTRHFQIKKNQKFSEDGQCSPCPDLAPHLHFWHSTCSFTTKRLYLPRMLFHPIWYYGLILATLEPPLLMSRPII